MTSAGDIVEVRGYPGDWRVDQTWPSMVRLRRQGDSRMLLELVGTDQERIRVKRAAAPPAPKIAPKKPRRRKAFHA